MSIETLRGYYNAVIDLKSFLFPLRSAEVLNPYFDNVIACYRRDDQLERTQNITYKSLGNDIVHQKFDSHRQCMMSAISHLLQKRSKSILTLGFITSKDASSDGRVSVVSEKSNSIVDYLCTKEWRELSAQVGLSLFFSVITSDHVTLYEILPNDCVVQLTGEPIATGIENLGNPYNRPLASSLIPSDRQLFPLSYLLLSNANDVVEGFPKDNILTFLVQKRKAFRQDYPLVVDLDEICARSLINSIFIRRSHCDSRRCLIKHSIAVDRKQLIDIAISLKTYCELSTYGSRVLRRNFLQSGALYVPTTLQNCIPLFVKLINNADRLRINNILDGLEKSPEFLEEMRQIRASLALSGSPNVLAVKCAYSKSFVSSFIRQTLLLLLPVDLRGNSRTTRRLLSFVCTHVVRGHLHDSTRLSALFSGFSTKSLTFLTRGKTCTLAMNIWSKSYLLWLAESLMHLLRGSFYCMKCAVTGKSFLFFRKAYWRRLEHGATNCIISKLSLKELNSHQLSSVRSTFQVGKLPTHPVNDLFSQSQKVAVASIRFEPKTMGMRPICDLSVVPSTPLISLALQEPFKSPESRVGESVSQQKNISPNASLSHVLQILQFETARNNQALGAHCRSSRELHLFLSSVKKTNTEFCKFRNIIQTMKRNDFRYSLFAADVEAAFDSIDQTRLEALLDTFLKTEQYGISKYSIVTSVPFSSSSSVVPTPIYRTCRRSRVCDYRKPESFMNYLRRLQKCIRDSSVNRGVCMKSNSSIQFQNGEDNNFLQILPKAAVVTDLVYMQYFDVARIKADIKRHLHYTFLLLRSFCDTGSTQTRPRLYKAFRGIPQGSVLSSIMSTLYLGALELNWQSDMRRLLEEFSLRRTLQMSSMVPVRLTSESVHCIRLADDYLCVSPDSEILHLTFGSLQNSLRKGGLCLKMSKVQFSSSDCSTPTLLVNGDQSSIRNVSRKRQREVDLGDVHADNEDKCNSSSLDRQPFNSLNWCGFAVDRRLNVGEDFSRISESRLQHTLSYRNGFMTKQDLEQSLRIILRPTNNWALFDCSLNSEESVVRNLTKTALVAVSKLVLILRRTPIKNGLVLAQVVLHALGKAPSAIYRLCPWKKWNNSEQIFVVSADSTHLGCKGTTDTEHNDGIGILPTKHLRTENMPNSNQGNVTFCSLTEAEIMFCYYSAFSTVLQRYCGGSSPIRHLVAEINTRKFFCGKTSLYAISKCNQGSVVPTNVCIPFSLKDFAIKPCKGSLRRVVRVVVSDTLREMNGFFCYKWKQ